MANPLARAVSRGVRASFDGASSSYRGAANTRFTDDWIFATTQSADQEIRGGLRQLRQRSRELVRNNDTATRYVQLLQDQAIGHDGIRFQATVTRGTDGLFDSNINREIESAWGEWCEPDTCTTDGRLHFVEVLQQIVQTLPQDGEFLMRMLPFERRSASGRVFGMALDLLDADQLDETYSVAGGPDRNEIRMGVEVDRWQRPVAYHVWDHHPSEGGMSDRRRLPAEQVIHLYRPARVKATRAVPWFTPALLKLQYTAGYEEAAVIAARMGASQGGFFEQDAQSVDDPNAVIDAEADEQFEFEIEPGKFDRLPVGWKFKEFRPEHPKETFAEFHRAMIRGIANGLGVSYTSLANDLENVNFSSIRAGLLTERDAYRRLQWWLIRHVCERVYREWFRWAMTTGALALPMRNRDRWLRHRWQPRGWPWVDPEKDIRASLLEIRAGLNSRTRIAAERGLDLEEVFDDLAMEERLAAAKGITLTTDTSRGGGAVPSPDGASAEIDEVMLSLERRGHVLNGNGRLS